MNHYVYLITNNINNKKYIGKRTCKGPIEEDSYMGSGKYLWNAINKHGIENFSKKIIEVCETEEICFEREKYWIDKFDTYNNGYNLTFGGEGASGLVHSEETRKKISESNRSRIYSEETRKKISESKKGKKLSEETKRKLSKSKKGRYIGENNPMSKKAIAEIDNVVYVKSTSKEMIDFITKEFRFIGVSNWFKKNLGVPPKYRDRVSLVMLQTKDGTQTTIYHINENCKFDYTQDIV